MCPIKIPADYFVDTDKLILKFRWRQKIQNSPHSSEAEERSRRADPTQLQDTRKLQWSMPCHERRNTHRSLPQNRARKRTPFHTAMDAWRRSQDDMMEQRQCLQHVVLELLDIHMQNDVSRHTLYIFHQINYKWIKDLSVKCNTRKLLGDNAGENLDELRFGDEFLDKTPEAWPMKKISCTSLKWKLLLCGRQCQGKKDEPHVGKNTVLFPLTVGDMSQDSQWMPETMHSTKPYINSHMYAPFHCKEALYSFSLPYQNFQRHYCALEPLLCK